VPFTVTVPLVVPVPPKVAPLATVIPVVVGIVPVMLSFPAETVVGPAPDPSATSFFSVGAASFAAEQVPSLALVPADSSAASLTFYFANRRPIQLPPPPAYLSV